MKITRAVVKDKKLGILNVDKIDFIEETVWLTRIVKIKGVPVEEDHKVERYKRLLGNCDFIWRTD